MSLRNKIIRLAHQKPELRKHLLPLVTKTAYVHPEDIAEFKSYVSEFYVPSNRKVLYPLYKGKKPLTEKVLSQVIDAYVAKKSPSKSQVDTSISLESIEREQVSEILYRMGYEELLVDFKFQGQWSKMQKAKRLIVQGKYYKVIGSNPYEISIISEVTGTQYQLAPFMRSALIIRDKRGRPINRNIQYKDIEMR